MSMKYLGGECIHVYVDDPSHSSCTYAIKNVVINTPLLPNHTYTHMHTRPLYS